MLEKNPNLTRVEIENVLKSTADKIGGVSYDANGRNDLYGHGKVNLGRIMSNI
jgi:thermitase